MTSRRFPAPLRLELRPSRWFCAGLLLVHGLVLLSLALSALNAGLLAFSTFIVCFSAFYHLHSHIRQTGPYPLRALIYRQGHWCVVDASGELPAQLLSSWVRPLAVGMELRARCRLRLLVLADSCDPDEFRRLRQILRFARTVPGVENGIDGLG